MLEKLIKGFVEGILQPIIQYFTTKKLGVKEQQLSDSEAERKKEQDINDAVGKVPELPPVGSEFDDFLRGGGPGGKLAPPGSSAPRSQTPGKP